MYHGDSDFDVETASEVPSNRGLKPSDVKQAYLNYGIDKYWYYFFVILPLIRNIFITDDIPSDNPDVETDNDDDFSSDGYSGFLSSEDSNTQSDLSSNNGTDHDPHDFFKDPYDTNVQVHINSTIG